MGHASVHYFCGTLLFTLGMTWFYAYHHHHLLAVFHRKPHAQHSITNVPINKTFKCKHQRGWMGSHAFNIPLKMSTKTERMLSARRQNVEECNTKKEDYQEACCIFRATEARSGFSPGIQILNNWKQQAKGPSVKMGYYTFHTSNHCGCCIHIKPCLLYTSPSPRD